MRKFAILALAPVVALVAVGCGSSSSSSSNKSTSSAAAAPPPATTATPAASGNAIAVKETEFKLTPNAPSAKSGKVTISATNAGTVTHAIEVEGGGAGGKDARSADIAPGKSATLTVDLKPGKSYEWYCPIDNHKGMGMKGEIKVTGSTASASSAAKTSTGGASSGGSSTGSSSGGSSGY